MVQAFRLPIIPSILTLDDFLALPETRPVSEFIDGEIIRKPIPQGKHSAIQSELISTINNKLRGVKIARAFAELSCSFGDRAIVPDVSVFVWERIVCDESGDITNVFSIAPDWTIEILSPDQRQTKVVKNIAHCLRYGALMGWLIDPDDRTVFVYYPNGLMEIFDELELQLPMPEFTTDLLLTVADLFGWLVK